MSNMLLFKKAKSKNETQYIKQINRMKLVLLIKIFNKQWTVNL